MKWRRLLSSILYIPYGTVTIKRRFEYDHTGRPLKSFITINSQPEQEIASISYNELGMPIEKNLHKQGANDYLQSIDYSYNIRGWLTHINNSKLANDGITNDDTDDLFGMELLYNNTLDGMQHDKRYDGMLTAVKWQTKQTTVSANPQRERAYQFEYDRLNRLTEADYYANSNANDWQTTETGAYDASFTYDDNGNIAALERYFKANTSTNRELIDDLSFEYQDASSNPLGKQAGKSD